MTKTKVLAASLFLFALKLAFPAPASAMSSAEACAKNPWCAKEMLVGVKNTVSVATTKVAITVGTTKPVSDAVAPVVIVGSGAWYYWNQSQNP
jgi:hypothetical protein